MATANPKKMKICVLQSSYEESNSPFKGVDGYSDVAVHLQDHICDNVLLKKSNAAEHLRDLIKNGGYDVFVNLCDGSAHEDRAGIEVVQVLEKEGVPFTGADSNFFDPSKQQMKEAAVANGVMTSPYVFAFKEEDIAPAKKLHYPLIVKHYNGSGSIGTSKDSKVWNEEQLFTQAKKMIKEHGGALIEEFISGKEYTVLVAENISDEANPIAFTPVECAFPEGHDFKHFDMKWVDFAALKWVPCADEKLAEKMKEMTKKIFVAMKGVSYGRADIRVDKDGVPYFLEINPNCGIFSPPNEEGSAADFILMNDKMKHRGFLEHIIHVAIERSKRLKKQTPSS